MPIFTVIFPRDFTKQDFFEMPFRGYVSDVQVVSEYGQKFLVNFYDLTRLQQELDDMVLREEPFISKPGLIIIKEVNIENIEKAVRILGERGFFEHFNPVN